MPIPRAQEHREPVYETPAVQAVARPVADLSDEGQFSLLGMASVLLRYRRRIAGLVLAGAVLGAASAILSRRVYQSSATFIPQGTDANNAGLALAASQLGIKMPSTGGGWGPPIYVELLNSRALLEPLALDTLVVPEEGQRQMALMDLVGVKAPTPALRLERTVRELANTVVSASEDRRLGAVRLTATTRWPTVSLNLAQQLVKGVNQFNVVTRKSQATAERQFAEVQEGEAERALRDAEDRLQQFLQGNRTIVTPELGFQRDRLQRNVTLRQQVYTSLVQSREEARIREVRDTPVITVIEDPRLPVLAESRGVVLKTILGALLGAIVGVVVAFVTHALNVARRASSTEAREFFDLVGQATPRFLRMRMKNVVAS